MVVRFDQARKHLVDFGVRPSDHMISTIATRQRDGVAIIGALGERVFLTGSGWARHFYYASRSHSRHVIRSDDFADLAVSPAPKAH
jgi:hypothetical protein